MKLRTDRGGLGHRGDRFGTQVLGVRTGEPDPLDARHLAEGSQEFGEQWSSPGDVAAVRIDVLTQDCEFDDARRRQHGRLFDQVRHRTTDLTSAHRRHDAVAAGVVTARLDGDPRGVGALAHGVKGRRHVEVGLRIGCVQYLGERSFATRATQQRRRGGEVVGAKDDVDPRGPLLDRAAVLLGHAAAHRDLHVRALLLERL